MSIVYNDIHKTKEVTRNSASTINSLNSAQSQLQILQSQLNSARSSLNSTTSTSFSLQSQLSTVQSCLSNKQSESQNASIQVTQVQQAVADLEHRVEEAKKQFGEFLKAKCYQQQNPAPVLKADVIGRNSIFGYFESLLRKENRIFENFLFYGVSGNGKTYLANALAHLCGYNFKKISKGDVIDLSDDQTIELLGYTFEAARKQLPCIVLLDDLDFMFDHFDSSHMQNLFHSTLLQQLDGLFANHQQMVIVTVTDISAVSSRTALLSRINNTFYLDGAAGEEKLAYIRRQVQMGRNGKFGLEWKAGTDTSVVAAVVSWCPTFGLLDWYMMRASALAGLKPASVEIFRNAVNSIKASALETSEYDKFIFENNTFSIMDF